MFCMFHNVSQYLNDVLIELENAQFDTDYKRFATALNRFMFY